MRNMNRAREYRRRMLERIAANAFCPTGQGGGVDPSCAPGAGAGGMPAHHKVESTFERDLSPDEVKGLSLKFQRGSQQAALQSAAKASHRAGGEPRFVKPTAGGLVVMDQRPEHPTPKYHEVSLKDGKLKGRLVTIGPKHQG